jgi:hypothetical protein
MCGDSGFDWEKENSRGARLPAIQSPKLFLVPAVNWTGCLFFCCITLARDATWPPWQTSLTRSRTKSHPRNSLSIAKLKNAKSRVLLKISKRTRICPDFAYTQRRFLPDQLAFVPWRSSTTTFHMIVHDRPPGLKLYYALDGR